MLQILSLTMDAITFKSSFCISADVYNAFFGPYLPCVELWGHVYQPSLKFLKVTPVIYGPLWI